MTNDGAFAVMTLVPAATTAICENLGSASLTTDAAGEVVSKQRTYPFGAVREQEGESPTDFGFTGQRLDDSTGLMYYRARY